MTIADTAISSIDSESVIVPREMGVEFLSAVTDCGMLLLTTV
jgi:hypothetical protein